MEFPGSGRCVGSGWVYGLGNCTLWRLESSSTQASYWSHRNCDSINSSHSTFCFQRSWMRTLALVVNGMMNPSGSYWLAKVLYRFLSVGWRDSKVQCLYPSASSRQLHCRPRVGSWRSVLFRDNHSSLLADLASGGRCSMTEGKLLTHCLISKPPSARPVLNHSPWHWP